MKLCRPAYFVRTTQLYKAFEVKLETHNMYRKRKKYLFVGKALLQRQISKLLLSTYLRLNIRELQRIIFKINVERTQWFIVTAPLFKILPPRKKSRFKWSSWPENIAFPSQLGGRNVCQPTQPSTHKPRRRRKSAHFLQCW